MTKPLYTPLGTASWCDLQTPKLYKDAPRWIGDKGRYSVTLAFDPNDEKFIEFQDNAGVVGNALFSELDMASKKPMIKADGFLPIENEEDEEGNPTGRIVIKASLNAGGITQTGPRAGQEWSRSVVLVDHNNEKVEYDGQLGRGTRMILSVQPKAYKVPGSKKNEARIKFEIRAAMVVTPEFRQGQVTNDFAGFEVPEEEFEGKLAGSSDGDF